MHRILITNDDGILADGIIRLATAAKAFGEVWIVAPESQRSAASHAITLHGTVDVYPHEFPVPNVRAFACSGTPADCVRVGALYVMPEKPDTVLSGINHGYNTATDIQYSGTAGAAFEAAFQGLRGVALSEQTCESHAVTDAFLHAMLTEAFAADLHYGQIVNINFPGCPLAECKGIRRNTRVSHGMFYTDRYKKTASLENGGVRLTVDGLYGEDAEPGTDFEAVVQKYISFGIVQNISSAEADNEDRLET